MCIIVAKPGNQIVPKETFENCFENNSDGAGYMFADKRANRLIIKKGFFTFDDFWNEWKNDQTRKAILHFRIKTHGKIDQENCHPYIVEEDTLAFAHNGMINIDTKSDMTKSDTWHFNESYIKELFRTVPDFLQNAVIQAFISDFIGYSKLAFMNGKGDISIINGHMGTVDNNVWFSNESFKKRSWKNYSSYTAPDSDNNGRRRGKDNKHAGSSSSGSNGNILEFKIGDPVEILYGTHKGEDGFIFDGFGQGATCYIKHKERDLRITTSVGILDVVRKKQETPMPPAILTNPANYNRTDKFEPDTYVSLRSDWGKFKEGDCFTVEQDEGNPFVKCSDIYEDKIVYLPYSHLEEVTIFNKDRTNFGG